MIEELELIFSEYESSPSNLCGPHESEVIVSEPPLTKFLEQADILRYIENANLLDHLILPRISKFPCRKQATERYAVVKIVTESVAACGPESREGFIKTRLRSSE
nr:unnamed protein product [Callosobruchus analis]